MPTVILRHLSDIRISFHQVPFSAVLSFVILLISTPFCFATSAIRCSVGFLWFLEDIEETSLQHDGGSGQFLSRLVFHRMLFQVLGPEEHDR